MSDVHDPFEYLHRPNQPATPRAGFQSALKSALAQAAAEPTYTDQINVDFTSQQHAKRKLTMTTSVIPYLCMTDAKAALDFYVTAFGAVETSRLLDPKDGRVGHAEIQLGENMVYLSDEFPEIGVRSPTHADFHSTSLVLNVSDADAVFTQAVAAGATIERPLADQFYGQRSGTILDPYGYRWMINSPIETLTTEEQQRRYDEVGSE
jgi:PhnB protein